MADALIQATAGATGGVFASFVLMPLDIVKTRVQISQTGDATLLKMFGQILKEEGLASLFRGSAAKCSETGSKNFVFFYIYDAINRRAKLRTQITPTINLVLGYISGLCTTCLTMPLEVLSTRQQVSTGKSGGGFFAVLGDILSNEGVPGLFKGFWFNVLLCINPAIQNTVFDRVKDALLLRKSGGNMEGFKQDRVKFVKRVSMTPLEAFMLGALSKAVATVLTFPMVRLKTMLQAGKAIAAPADAGDDGPHHSLSTGQLVRRLSFRSDLSAQVQNQVQRFCELYRGIAPALLKGVLQAGLLYFTKDQVAKVVTLLMKTSMSMLRPGQEKRHKFRALSGRPLAS